MQFKIILLGAVIFLMTSCTSSVIEKKTSPSVIAISSVSHKKPFKSTMFIGSNVQIEQTGLITYSSQEITEIIKPIRKRVRDTICPLVGDADVGVWVGAGLGVEVIFHCK